MQGSCGNAEWKRHPLQNSPILDLQKKRQVVLPAL